MIRKTLLALTAAIGMIGGNELTTSTAEAQGQFKLGVAGKNGAEGTIRLNHALATSLLVRCAQPGWIELSWPADATNFFPEMTTNFFESASWSSITNTPLVFTNRRVLHLERAASREIYRLRLNPAP